MKVSGWRTLGACAGEVAQRVLRVGREQGRSYYGSTHPALAVGGPRNRPHGPSIEPATWVVGRRMATGQGSSTDELESVARMGSDVAEGRTLLALRLFL